MQNPSTPDESTQNNKPITAIIVGAGHRAIMYAMYSQLQPNRFKIVGVADPNEIRRKDAQKRFGFSDDMCFESAEDLATHGRLADAIINGTMDHQHVPTSIPLLKLGYDMLLEKPFAVNTDEMFELLEVAREHGATVMICHVLRYAPFYQKIKEIILSGEIGEIINIQMAELVSYHHLAVSFVRGKWGNQILCHAPLLLAKCCHDMDMMMWLKGERPSIVSSFGSDFQFRPERKPEGSGTRCLVDCPLVDSCLYSAKSHHLDHPDRWSFYVWDSIEHIENPTLEDKRRSLETDNIHGRCVWDCDHDNVDHQVVTVNFRDGSSGTLNLVGGTAKGDRTIHIVGTRGEIQGAFSEEAFKLRKITPSSETGYSEETIHVGELGDTTGAYGGHGGGDLRLVEDFVNVLHGDEPSISATSLDDSVLGHLVVFKAGESLNSRQTVPLDEVLMSHKL